jgi:hypothetical protein
MLNFVMPSVYILTFPMQNLILIVVILSAIVILMLVTSWHRDRSVYKDFVWVWVQVRPPERCFLA